MILLVLYGCSASQSHIKLIKVIKVSKQQFLSAPEKYKAIELSYGEPMKTRGDLNGYGNIFYKIIFNSTVDLNNKPTNIAGIVPDIMECVSRKEFSWNYIYNLPNENYFTFLAAQDYYGKEKHDFLSKPIDLCFSIRFISMLGDKKSNTIRISKKLLQ